MKNKNTTYLVRLSLLMALELILAYTPIGYFRTAGLSISFLSIPVVIGAIILGPAAGAVLGGIFGLTSFGTCFGSDPFGAALLGINPVFTFLVCVPTRILMGWLAGLIFKAIYKKEKSHHIVSYFVASLAGPVLNTLLFMSTLVLFFYRSEYIQAVAEGIGATNPFMFIVILVGVQGLIEAVVGCVLSFSISKALSKALHK